MVERRVLVRAVQQLGDVASKVWNGMIDGRPSLTLYCAGVEDVRRVVNFAGTNNLLLLQYAHTHTTESSTPYGLLRYLSACQSFSHRWPSIR